MTVTKNEVRTATYTMELDPTEMAQLLRALVGAEAWYREAFGRNSPNIPGITKMHDKIKAAL